MKFVHSFWFKPFHACAKERGCGGFPAPKDFLVNWALSATLATRFIGEGQFVTDSFGAEIAAALKLPYREISTILDSLDVDPLFWNAGKITAHLLQDKPYVHLDMDVFLGKSLPLAIHSAPVFGQSREHRKQFANYYDPNIAAMRNYLRDPPLCVSHCDALDPANSFDYALNCGIFGGNNLTLLQRYAKDWMRVLSAESNLPGWQKLAAAPHCSLGASSVAIEQLDIVWHCRDAGFEPVVLLEAATLSEQDYAAAGYTHLNALTKTYSQMLSIVELKLRQLEPTIMHRIENFLQTNPEVLGVQA